jgi:methylenetetrahydrofolate dehydrogenase (NADP+)/methenyltetrahydrofolate cyclohydrolase
MKTPILLNGKSLSEQIKQRLKLEVDGMHTKPTLATILVGNDPSSKVYVNMKINSCKQIGIHSRLIQLDESTTTDELLDKIKELNNDETVSGILLQHPCPPQINERLAFDTISPSKDVDGVNYSTFGKLSLGIKSFYPCTPLGIIMLLQYYKISMEGIHSVIVGRSPILGKPMAMMLLEKNATVTICHSKTKNLKDILLTADLVVGAVGKPEFIQSDWLKNRVILIDAGYNPGNVGDIDLKNSIPKSSHYTPVPGGVGPMTIACLLYQTVLTKNPKLEIDLVAENI